MGRNTAFAEHVERDRVRDEVLRRNGFHVVRFWNAEVDQNFDAVWSSIQDALLSSKLKPLWIDEFGSDAARPE